MPRKELIKKLANKGKTYAEIGKLLGISKQRVHQLFKQYFPIKQIQLKLYNPIIKKLKGRK